MAEDRVDIDRFRDLESAVYRIAGAESSATGAGFARWHAEDAEFVGAMYGVRATSPVPATHEGRPVDVRKGDLLLFDVEFLDPPPSRRAAGSPRAPIRRPGAFLGVVSRREQDRIVRCDRGGQPIVGLGADVREQFERLVARSAAEHLRDLAEIAPYARREVEKAIASPVLADLARRIGLKPRFEARPDAGEER